MNTPNELRLAGVVSDSVVDGPGLRLTIFVQGCPHNCPYCHNPETHDVNGGDVVDLVEFTQMIVDELTANPLLSGVTLSGGEPMEQAEALLYIANAVIEHGKNVVAFSGYTFEALQKKAEDTPAILELLSKCMLLVDGPYIHEKRNIGLKFRGSSNQRLIDPKKSLDSGEIVEWHSKFDII